MGTAAPALPLLLQLAAQPVFTYCPPPQRFLVERLYGSLTYLARPTTATYRLPRDGLLQLGIDYEL